MLSYRVGLPRFAAHEGSEQRCLRLGSRGPAPDALKSAAALGLDVKSSLADNDGHWYFGALGDEVVIGATLSNLNRAILVNRGHKEQPIRRCAIEVLSLSQIVATSVRRVPPYLSILHAETHPDHRAPDEPRLSYWLKGSLSTLVS
jgi:hypothetical protein